jgi:hypothetical protein
MVQITSESGGKKTWSFFFFFILYVGRPISTKVFKLLKMHFSKNRISVLMK